MNPAVFEIGIRFWAHKKWCPNFDALTIKKKNIAKPKFDTTEPIN